MITFVEERKKNRKLIKFLFIIILMVVGFLLFTFLRDRETINLAEPEGILPRMEGIRINFEILRNPLLEELQTFEEIQPYKDQVGRENPFLPY